MDFIVILLIVSFPDRIEKGCLVRLKLKTSSQITVDVTEIPPDISELLPNRFPHPTGRASPAFGKCKVIFPRFIQEGEILRNPDV